MNNVQILANFRAQIRVANPRFTQKRSSLNTLLKALDKRIDEGTDDNNEVFNEIRTAINKNDDRIAKYLPCLYRLYYSWGNNSLSYLSEQNKVNFAKLAALDPHLCYIKRGVATAASTTSYIKRFAFERPRAPLMRLSENDRQEILDIGMLNLSKLMLPGPLDEFCNEFPVRKLVRDLAALNDNDTTKWLAYFGFLVVNSPLVDFQRNPPQPTQQDDEQTRIEKNQRIDELELFAEFFKHSVTGGNIYNDIDFNTCHDTAKGLLKLLTTDLEDHCVLDKGEHEDNIDDAIAGLNDLLRDDSFVGKVIHIDIHDHSFSLWPCSVVTENSTDYERVESWAGQRWARGIDRRFVPSLSLMDCLANDDDSKKCTQLEVKDLLQKLAAGLQKIKDNSGVTQAIQFNKYSYFMGNRSELPESAITHHNFYLQSATPKTHDQMLATLRTCIGHANHIVDN